MRTISFVIVSAGLSLACVGLPPPPPASEASSSTTDPDPISTTTSGADTLATRGESPSDTTTTSDATTAGETTMAADPTGDESSSGPPPGCMGPGDCGSNEVCDNSVCVEACGGAWGAGSYDYCLTEYGAIATDDLCGAGHSCAYWGNPIEQTACTLQGCVDACDCPPPAATGNATVTCGEITAPMDVDDCYLSCENGEVCPEGMSCTEGVCATEVPEVSMYGDCGNLAPGCAAPAFCMDVPSGESVCMTGCTTPGDCPAAFPPGGNATVACTDLSPGMLGFECYLDCIGGITCPDGMTCINGTLCMWPD